MIINIYLIITELGLVSFEEYADRGWCSASVDNCFWVLHNSSHHTKAEFKNIFIIHSKYYETTFLDRILSSNICLFLGTVLGFKQMFFLARDTVIHWAIFFGDILRFFRLLSGYSSSDYRGGRHFFSKITPE